MKKFYKISILLLLIHSGLLLPQSFQADPPGMPSGHGADGDAHPSGTPVGGGILVLSTMALAYGLGKRKVSYQIIDDKTLGNR